MPCAYTTRALREAGRDVVTLPPTEQSLEEALRSDGSTPLGGWSLGAHLLLTAMGRRDPRLKDRQITLVSPFPAFPLEARRGGKSPLTSVKLLRRRMRADAAAALADFRTRAGILGEVDGTALPYSAAELDAGFAFLESLTGPDSPDLTCITLLGGETDALMDYASPEVGLPGLRVIAGAGHDLREFIPSLHPADAAR